MTAQPDLLPPLQQIPSDIVAAEDYERYAQPRLSPTAYAYFSEGSEKENLLGRNESQYQDHHIWPRVPSDLTAAHTHLDLGGRSYPFPIFLAPVAYQRLAHPEGERASALAAAAMKIPFTISMQSSVSLEALAQQAQGARWLQWYWQPDTTSSQRLLEKAEKTGIEAIVLTVDAPISGIRNRTQRMGFTLPEGIEAVLLQGFNRVFPPSAAAGTSPLLESGFLEYIPRWSDVEEFIKASPLPVWIKGVLHPVDAVRAAQAGAAGVIVSNHGGRVLDKAPTTLHALPGVVSALQGRIPVILDGGIRRGSDVFVALALGAKAVMVGRPYVYALATAGAIGVAHLLHILRTELEATMVLAGCATLADIQSSCLVQSPT